MLEKQVRLTINNKKKWLPVFIRDVNGKKGAIKGCNKETGMFKIHIYPEQFREPRKRILYSGLWWFSEDEFKVI